MWDDNIKIDLNDVILRLWSPFIRFRTVQWWSLVNLTINLRVAKGGRNFCRSSSIVREGFC
jgi:hypothetical protein